jgi:hypothetical protein
MRVRSASDHPRACGEHGTSAEAGIVHGGSSPRMRGTPRQPDLGQPEARIIPAHAGNTSTALNTWAATTECRKCSLKGNSPTILIIICMLNT